MYKPAVSVVINTHNRANQLKRLLDCLSRQTYDNFEVIVVNGPSTDHTQQVLDEYAAAIRVETCPEINLCMSRNIGVCASSGEIIAFIDDDAVPDNADWIAEGVIPFEDPTVGAVGGDSYRMNGEHEFYNGFCTILGEDIPVVNESKYDGCFDGVHFNRVIGCNCFFRRDAVEKIGGFDEYYLYFLDETDLCLRIVQAGYRVVHRNSAITYHEAAGGVNRKSPYHLNWRVIARSLGYYVMKSSVKSGLSLEERKETAIARCDHWLRHFDWLLAEKIITKEDYDSFVDGVTGGVREGIEDGLSKERILINKTAFFKPENFKKYEKSISRNNLNICMLCEDDVVHPIGGSAVHTNAIAKGLCALGHNVYVITSGIEECVTNIDGINYCKIVAKSISLPSLEQENLPKKRLEFSYACFKKIERLKSTFFFDIIETPLWGSLGLVATYFEKDIPVVTRLQTPLKMVMEAFKMENNSDLELLTQYESAMMEHSDAIITISDCVKNTIEELYEMKFTQPVYKNYLGIKENTPAVTTRTAGDGKLIVFFVGRLERRKGIDSILASIPQLMEKHDNLEFHLGGDFNIYDAVIGSTYKDKLLNEYADAAWIDRVKFMGKITDEEKEQEFADCDVFVSPSLYESFGIIFIEAMRYAKSVVGCCVGGMQEVIDNGKTGLLCEPGNAESFRNCLEQLLDDAELRTKMGRAGRERMEKMFTEQIMCRGTEEIYRKVIQTTKK